MEQDQSRDTLILRDHLALDRTRLANERTFLAYVRTALTLFIAGASFVRFFTSPTVVVTGWVFIPTGLLTLVVGIQRYCRMRQRMGSMERRYGSTTNGE